MAISGQLVFGFKIPKKIYDLIQEQNDVQLEIAEKLVEQKIILKELPFKITTNSRYDSEDVVIGISLEEFTQNIHQINIGVLNTKIDDNAVDVERIFQTMFSVILTHWSSEIKKIADLMKERYKDSNEPVEVPEIPIPGDELKVEWFVCIHN